MRALALLVAETGAARERRVAALDQSLSAPPAEGSTVVVGHASNLGAAAGVSLEEGELAVFDPLGDGLRLRGRLPPAARPRRAEAPAR